MPAKETTCPWCGKLCTDAEVIGDLTVTPGTDDFSMCIGCGEWSVFAPWLPDGLRKPFDDEYAVIAADPKMRKLREAWVWAVRYEKLRKRRERREARSR